MPPTSPAYDALTLDAAGTVLELAEPVERTYIRFAEGRGLRVAPGLRQRFRAAFAAPHEGLRYEGDGRPFWRRVVAATTGHNDEDLFEDLYAWYGLPDAWRVTPGLRTRLRALHARGMRTALISNWDTRLRPLLEQLDLDLLRPWIISAEVGLEKPDPRIFLLACERLGALPRRTLHLGDRTDADLEGAISAGLHARSVRERSLLELLDDLLGA